MIGPFTIAVDGPAAAGKGTISRALAEAFDLAHLDTGLLYRAVAQAALAGMNPVQAAQALSAEDLSNEGLLRTAEVAQEASRIAVLPDVRSALFDLQRAFARRAGGAVIDGRDIGTVICPQAEAKIFITASAEIRARRRLDELLGRGEASDYDNVLRDVKARDARDMSREDSPLKPADDARLLDTSNLSIDEALAQATAFVEPIFALRRGE
ncbi:MAG: cytidylate kinase [Marinovum sp.]|nr:cytidylate kinase [Marinovum sp.]